MDADGLRRAVAEFVGAFTLVFIGVGTVSTIPGSLVGVALAQGLVIAVMASAVGHISGGHFNPAVTFGFLVTRRMSAPLAGLYVVVQLAAAVAAMLMLRLVFPEQAHLDAGVPTLSPFVDPWQGMLIEAVLTFFLVWVIFATAADPRGSFKSIAGLAIGFTITLDILMGGPVTGAAVNPARAFGPELVQNVWDDAWVYYVGPLLGGAVAALTYEWLYLRPLAPEPVGPAETGLLEPRPGETAAS